MAENYFVELNNLNVSEHIEPKTGGGRTLNYLSWVWAWGELKKLHPDATYTVYENEKGWIYHTDGRTAWVKTGVTIDGIEHIECLPVMNKKNASLPLSELTSWDVNTAIQRSITKAIARHGLGLYIYAGEDLPEDEREAKKAEGKPEAGKKFTRDMKPTPEEEKALEDTNEEPIDEIHWKALQAEANKYGLVGKDILEYYKLTKASEITYRLFMIIRDDLPEIGQKKREAAEMDNAG